MIDSSILKRFKRFFPWDNFFNWKNFTLQLKSELIKKCIKFIEFLLETIFFDILQHQLVLDLYGKSIDYRIDYNIFYNQW